jgi:peptidoglycan hydrolase CwlO-like protein
MKKAEIESLLKEKNKKLQELQKQAAPINQQIYCLECEIYDLVSRRDEGEDE